MLAGPVSCVLFYVTTRDRGHRAPVHNKAARSHIAFSFSSMGLAALSPVPVKRCLCEAPNKLSPSHTPPDKVAMDASTNSESAIRYMLTECLWLCLAVFFVNEFS